jgi:hypothetical protein
VSVYDRGKYRADTELTKIEHKIKEDKECEEDKDVEGDDEDTHGDEESERGDGKGKE